MTELELKRYEAKFIKTRKEGFIPCGEALVGEVYLPDKEYFIINHGEYKNRLVRRDWCVVLYTGQHNASEERHPNVFNDTNRLKTEFSKSDTSSPRSKTVEEDGYEAAINAEMKKAAEART